MSGQPTQDDSPGNSGFDDIPDYVLDVDEFEDEVQEEDLTCHETVAELPLKLYYMRFYKKFF